MGRGKQILFIISIIKGYDLHRAKVDLRQKSYVLRLLGTIYNNLRNSILVLGQLNCKDKNHLKKSYFIFLRPPKHPYQACTAAFYAEYHIYFS